MSETAPDEPKLEKPRRRRDWRELLTELLIVVLGVGLALAAQQAADWWRWRKDVAEARQTIAGEMARNISYGIQRLRVAGCIQSRLQEIEKILEDAGRSGTLPPLGLPGNAPVVPWSSGVWESVVASQTATHFPRQQLASLSLSYARVQRVENWNRQEAEAWSTLNRLRGPGRHFDPAFGAELTKALGLAILHNGVITNTSSLFIQDILKQDLPFAAAEQQLMAEARTVPITGTGGMSVCNPISAVPIFNASAYFPPERLRQFEDVLKRLPFGAAR